MSDMKATHCTPPKAVNRPLKVVNIGLQSFAESLRSQGGKVVQINWRPPVHRDPEIGELLEDLL